MDNKDPMKELLNFIEENGVDDKNLALVVGYRIEDDGDAPPAKACFIAGNKDQIVKTILFILTNEELEKSGVLQAVFEGLADDVVNNLHKYTERMNKRRRACDVLDCKELDDSVN